ncbi:hypothetical protein [Vibrio phage phiKT1028]|nr:hypothetical protein [Vibrio phage phiKT1028]
MEILSKVITTTLDELDEQVKPFLIDKESLHEFGAIDHVQWRFKYYPKTDIERQYTNLDTHYDIDDQELDIFAGSFPLRIVTRYVSVQSLADWIPKSRTAPWLDAYLDYAVTMKQICDVMAKLGPLDEPLKYELNLHGFVSIVFKRTAEGRFQNIFRPTPLVNLLSQYDVERGSMYPRRIADWFRLNPGLGREVVLELRKQFFLLEGVVAEEYRAPKALRAMFELFKGNDSQKYMSTYGHLPAPRMASSHRGVKYICGVERRDYDLVVYVRSDKEDLWTFNMSTMEWDYPSSQLLPSDYLFIQNLTHVCFGHYLNQSEAEPIRKVQLARQFKDFMISPTEGNDRV